MSTKRQRQIRLRPRDVRRLVRQRDLRKGPPAEDPRRAASKDILNTIAFLLRACSRASFFHFESLRPKSHFGCQYYSYVLLFRTKTRAHIRAYFFPFDESLIIDLRVILDVFFSAQKRAHTINPSLSLDDMSFAFVSSAAVQKRVAGGGLVSTSSRCSSSSSSSSHRNASPHTHHRSEGVVHRRLCSTLLFAVGKICPSIGCHPLPKRLRRR